MTENVVFVLYNKLKLKKGVKFMTKKPEPQFSKLPLYTIGKSKMASGIRVVDAYLFLAIEYSNLREVKTYIANGADLNAKPTYGEEKIDDWPLISQDYVGKTPLQYAKEIGNTEIIKYLESK